MKDKKVTDAGVTALVDEIFRVCGPIAVQDVRSFCEKVEKVKR